MNTRNYSGLSRGVPHDYHARMGELIMQRHGRQTMKGPYPVKRSAEGSHPLERSAIINYGEIPRCGITAMIGRNRHVFGSEPNPTFNLRLV